MLLLQIELVVIADRLMSSLSYRNLLRKVPPVVMNYRRIFSLIVKLSRQDVFLIALFEGHPRQFITAQFCCDVT